MITEFKIFENIYQDELIDMGYGIFLYKNIFFKKGVPKPGNSTSNYFVQYDIQDFLRIKETIIVNYIFSRMLGKTKSIKNWWYYFIRDYKEIFTNKLIFNLIELLLKKKPIEQFCVIKYIMLDMYENVEEGGVVNKKIDSIENLLKRSEIETIVDIVLDYYDENSNNGFNKDLGYKELGKSIEEAKEAIEKFFIEQEMDKYNL